MAYLTPEEAHTRLQAFEIDALPTLGDLEMASRRLDLSGPFYGSRSEYDQPHAFPRTHTLEGDVYGEVPETILDWVAIEAYRVGTTPGAGDSPPISSISHSAAGSVTYSRPKMARHQWLQAGLLSRYQRKTGTIR